MKYHEDMKKVGNGTQTDCFVQTKRLLSQFTRSYFLLTFFTQGTTTLENGIKMFACFYICCNIYLTIYAHMDN